MWIKDILVKQKNNSKNAVIYNSQKISYSELFQKSILISETIEKQALCHKSIGIYIKNSINYVFSYFSIANLEKVIVPINVQLKEAELISMVKYLELGMIITDSLHIHMLEQLLKNYEYKIIVFELDSMQFHSIGGENALPCLTDSNELDDVAIMIHTSGSLSYPKSVMLTNNNLRACVNSIINSLNLCENDTTLIVSPLFLAAANTSQLLTHIYLGATIVIMDAMFTPEYFFKLVEKFGVTNFTGVAYMVIRLMNDKNKENYNLSTLKQICFGGSCTSASKIKSFIDIFPTINFIHMYGLTEASPRVSHLLPQYSKSKCGSVGKPIPDVEVRIIHDNGLDVCANERGELIVRGENVMKGYYKRPKETNRVLIDGWLHTGDLASFDDEGFIYIVGRIKNMIVSCGVNIYPEEIEEVLLQHPAVNEACVIAEEDELVGEVPIAKIVLNNEVAGIDENELLKLCLKNLVNYKIPKRFIFVDNLEKTPSNKVKRIYK